MTANTFTLIKEHTIDTLQTTVQAYQHQATGAMHYHFANERDENVFLVALRTLPQDSSGVAHILEHTVLCGSQRFPVRDPFFMMIRRSLNTFMNALTSSDWTAYPFATQNRKDFDHLLQVYLDAVFFSRLDPLDFSQEGHRIEFSEPTNPASELVFKGIVYNEMKGAMSSINSILWHTLSQHFQPDTTYQNNSGGAPAKIPDLSHEQLLAFYKTHYHPSNSVFMTFGNIPACDHQARIETLALQHFSKQTKQLRAEQQERFTEPRQVQAEYPYTLSDGETQAKNKDYILISWMLGQSNNLDDVLTAQLLAGVLLENSAAPLQHYLETTPLGSSPSALCGMDNSGREIAFVCGIEGSSATRAEQFEQEVLALLTSLVDNGIDTTLVESTLHQIELSQREITGNSYPYGLSLMFAALPGALHDGDPIQLLDINPALERLREKIKDRAFLPALIRQYLLDNSHRLRLSMVANSELQAQQDHAEKQHLATLAASLSEDEKQQIITRSQALSERQREVDDPNILPKLALSDIPAERSFPHADHSHQQFTYYPQATNGLVYQDIRLCIPSLSTEQLALMPLFSSCLTELGTGDTSYLDIQQQQSANTGGVSAFYQIRENNEKACIQAYWGISGKALTHNYHQLSKLQLQHLCHPRFDELQRLRELVAQIRASAEKSITGSGHALAMLAAASSHTSVAAMQHNLSGLPSIQYIQQLDDTLNDEQHLADFANRLQQLHQDLLNHDANILLIAEPELQAQFDKQLTGAIADIYPDLRNTSTATQTFELTLANTTSKQLWLTQTQVNFCAKVFPSVKFTHPDAPALTVLGSFLRNGFLHRSIREQGGAYGGGASQDNRLGLFKFYSYRDPRLLATLADFDQSIDWLLTNQHTQQTLEEAIFTVIASIDKPASPAGEARSDYTSQLFGTSIEQQQAFRQGVLETSIETLMQVAQRYLGKSQSTQASSAIISSEMIIDDADIDFTAQGFEVFHL